MVSVWLLIVLVQGGAFGALDYRTAEECKVERPKVAAMPDVIALSECFQLNLVLNIAPPPKVGL